VGEILGSNVGVPEFGAAEGRPLGISDGCLVGTRGAPVGIQVMVGFEDGEEEGNSDSSVVGTTDGDSTMGLSVGRSEGVPVGKAVGLAAG